MSSTFRNPNTSLEGAALHLTLHQTKDFWENLWQRRVEVRVWNSSPLETGGGIHFILKVLDLVPPVFGQFPHLLALCWPRSLSDKGVQCLQVIMQAEHADTRLIFAETGIETGNQLCDDGDQTAWLLEIRVSKSLLWFISGRVSAIFNKVERRNRLTFSSQRALR